MDKEATTRAEDTEGSPTGKKRGIRRSRDGKTRRIKGSKIIESGQDADVHLVLEVAGGAAKKLTNYVNDVNIVNTVAFSVERLSTAFFNARSIVNKFDEFEVFVHNKEPDIIDVSETWLHAGIPYSEVELKGNCMYRGDRTGEEEDACSISRKPSRGKRW